MPMIMPAARLGWIFFATAGWTSFVATPLSLALLIGQHHYLRGSTPDPGRLVIGAAGAAVAVIAGGLVGQFCFCFAPTD